MGFFELNFDIITMLKIHTFVYTKYIFMEKTRKLIDVNSDVLRILEEEAKRQNRSLKSLMEYTLEDTARKLASPSAEYKIMMDDMLKKLDAGKLDFTPIDDLRAKYGV